MPFDQTVDSGFDDSQLEAKVMSDGQIPLAGDSDREDPLQPAGIGPEDDGLWDGITDGAGKAATYTGGKMKKMFFTVIKNFYRYLIVVFLPIPVRFLARKQLAFVVDKNDSNRLEFFSQPNLVTAIHMIWVGWLVGACALYNHLQTNEDYQLTQSVIHGLEWVWIVVLCLTILVMGIQFGRVAAGFLLTSIVIFILSVLLYEQMGEVEILNKAQGLLEGVDVALGWGVPILVSLVLGVTMLFSSIWQQLDDRWTVAQQGNFLEHENFQQKDRTIQKGAKTFIHSWPCLLRRFLLFGFGEIEVRDSRGQTAIERIEGVFWAKGVSERLKSRFESTDVRGMGGTQGIGGMSVAELIEEEEEEI
ncbi:MAG TPA: hypothetical protein DCE47_22180 [Planctomycetaceae bacterium]|nr:hypothetical protein [Planctomycetaceae bacterium]HCC99724.1 hypothetical protein [Planctomycetaceae bacterium]